MKKLCSLALALALSLSLVSCAKPQTQTPAGSAATSTPASSSVPSFPQAEVEAVSYPLTLTDQTGRPVVLQQRPQRLVSGYYISTSALIALGLEDSLVGIEAKADKRPIYRLSAPQLLELPSVGTAKEFDLEGCIALEPDLVILPSKLKSVVEPLEQMSIPVLLVEPESQLLLEQMMELLAQATDTQAEALALSDFRLEQEQLLEQRLAGIDSPGVYLAGNSDFLSTAGSGMYQSDMIARAGGRNVADEIQGDYWVDISYEQLLSWDPEYIILTSEASYSVEDVLADPNLSDCTAVKEGRVYKMPGSVEAWDSPVPSGILGSLWMAAVLHPEQLSSEERLEITGGFYERFYGFSYSEE